MRLTEYTHVDDFLAAAEPALLAHEAENNLPLGIANRIRQEPHLIDITPFMATVADDEGLILIVLRTPPYNLILHAERQEAAAIALLASHMHAHGHVLGGVTGVVATAKAFAEAWSAHANIPYRLHQSMRVFELRQVIPPPQPLGKARLAAEQDIPLLAQWRYDFAIEANVDRLTLEQAHERTALQVAKGADYVWQAAAEALPSCLVATSRRTAHGIVIGPVYTPPDQRGRGYASALTAFVSQAMLDSGYQFCALFTDLANPTSNSIYQKIGYRPLNDFSDYRFG
ncbi:MAG: hypothetical protein DYG88_01795 [Chloroflexi bacterium CFX4]|nr:hypothetical protein [Chloroflexi bacterium CFX4]MDL1921368.1 hypothetical protein [Chloroflexi bacterium CFX3]